MIPKIYIGSSFVFYLLFEKNVADYSAVEVTLRSKDSADQAIASFDKAKLRIDTVNPKKAYCDVDALDSAKAYSTTYEVVAKTTSVNAHFASGVEPLVYKFDLVKFETV